MSIFVTSEKTKKMASVSNNHIKLIRSLSEKKFRDEYGLFVVEGEKLVNEALKSGLEVEEIYRIEEIGEKLMSRISSLSSPSPVLALVRIPDSLTEDKGPLKKGLYLALDSLRDPGNLGTILRISDWFGVEKVYASADSVDVFNPKTVQSTMGAIFRVKFQYTDLCRLTDRFLSCGGKVYGTFLDGQLIYGQKLETGEDSPALIVIGNESRGISAQLAQKVTDRLYIPPYPVNDPGSESLNAAVATAITVAEFRRRTFK